MYWKRSNPNCNGPDMIKWHWGPPASKMSNSRLSKRTGCQYVGYFYYSENLNWAARNVRLGRMWHARRGLDIAGLDEESQATSLRKLPYHTTQCRFLRESQRKSLHVWSADDSRRITISPLCVNSANGLLQCSTFCWLHRFLFSRRRLRTNFLSLRAQPANSRPRRFSRSGKHKRIVNCTEFLSVLLDQCAQPMTDLRVSQIGHGLGLRATLSYDDSLLT